MRNVQKVMNYSFDQRKSANTLSVAGLLLIPALFPLWFGFILEVIPPRLYWENLTFRELTDVHHPYVTGIKNVEDYEDLRRRDVGYLQQ